MAVKEVLVYPNPILKQEAKNVEKIDKKIKQIIDDLIDTMDNSGHSVGIAAPQIGELYRIICY